MKKRNSDILYLILFVVLLGVFIFGLVGILNANLNPFRISESNYKFESNTGALQLENSDLDTVRSNQGFDTNVIVSTPKAPVSFPVAEKEYVLCDIALFNPDWYDHLSNEAKATRPLKGYDPRLYCPESRWPAIPEWAK